VRSAADDAIASALDLLHLNVREAQVEAEHIERLRERSRTIALVLNSVSALLAVVMAYLIISVIRRQSRLERANRLLLEQRARELDQFAARVAHDIRGPLSSVKMAHDLMREALTADRHRTFLGRATSGIDRVLSLVDGLYAFASAGARPSPATSADIGAVVHGLFEELRPVAQAADVTMCVEDGGVEGQVACDRGVLSSMLGNLMQNAIKYTAGSVERSVILRISDVGEFVRFVVEDTGPGMAPELAASVFEPYVRGRDSRAPGLGLGLATVKRLAEGHGGAVGVHSALGRGTKFWCELPRFHAV
jgi:signal transduction histidine kinase